jgi:hypothetical protein
VVSLSNLPAPGGRGLQNGFSRVPEAISIQAKDPAVEGTPGLDIVKFDVTRALDFTTVESPSVEINSPHH